MEYKVVNNKYYIKINDNWVEVSKDDLSNSIADEEYIKTIEKLINNGSYQVKSESEDYEDGLAKRLEDMLKNSAYMGMTPKILVIRVSKIKNNFNAEEMKEKEPLVDVIEQEKDYIVVVEPGRRITKENTKSIDYNPETNMLEITYKNSEEQDEVYSLKLKKIKGKAKPKEMNSNNGVLEIILEKEE